MNKSAKKPNILLWVSLVITLLVVAWSALMDPQNEEVTIASPYLNTKRSSTSFNTETQASIDDYRRPLIKYLPTQVFEIDPPEIISIVETAPSEPIAPALPFKYAGRLIRDDDYLIFLLNGKENVVVGTGDVVDEVWKVTAISPTDIRFNYLPLNKESLLNIGEVD